LKLASSVVQTGSGRTLSGNDPGIDRAYGSRGATPARLPAAAVRRRRCGASGQIPVLCRAGYWCSKRPEDAEEPDL